MDKLCCSGDTVLYGNNEDYMRTLTYYWVRLPGKDTYRGSYPCWRFDKSEEMLKKIKSEEDLFSPGTVKKAEQEHQKYKDKKIS